MSCNDPACPLTGVPSAAGHVHMLGPDRPLGNGEEWPETWSQRIAELPDGRVEGELLVERTGDPLVHQHLLVSGQRLARAFDDMAEVYGHVGRVFGQQRRLILRSVYRAGLLPWPIPASSCRYPHRHRWAGRSPRR